ncbi:MAG TPA: AI-2E family transporter [Candidatus Scatovivens faecipullorum]|nr:AI-2E family transporter [Candidatus Scatovivens faecipullorum]
MESEKKDLRNLLKVIIIAIIIYWGINNFGIIGTVFGKIIEIVFPFILGGALAFILNIPMTFFENKLSKIKNKKRKSLINKNLIRFISLILAIIVITFILYLIINLIVPELIDIIKLLVSNIPYYAEEINKFINSNTENIQEIDSLISGMNFDTDSIKNELMEILSSVLSSSVSLVMGVVGLITNLIIAIIFAIYILTSKEKLKNQVLRIIKAYCKKEKAIKIIEVGRITNKTFKNFLTVQALEATILGSLCIIGMLILKIPYAVPIGVLVGVTALIPVVGAFIGIIIGAILILSAEPIKVITFIIFVLILQQVEGNVIYPRVVGGSVGLPGMWVLVAVTVGGSLFGILGMLLGVPVFSVIYSMIKKDTEKRLNNTNS